tara:strand:- start:203 stop:412 length:210 start_codon:yes stop_codon:yes gene_type:complete
MKNEMKYIESADISKVVITGVNPKDAPDFVDSYVESCDIDGREATEAELDFINENMSHVAQECAFMSLI